MFCPSCGSEYREGFSRCADCEVALVDALPSSTDAHLDTDDVLTVFATGDPVLLLTAQSLLDEAGIPYFTRGEGTQDLFGMGRLGTGFNLISGPIEIRVDGERYLEAADLLREADLEPAGDGIEGEEPEEEDDDEVES